MSLKHLEKFWLQAEKSGDDKLLGHRMTLKHTFVPAWGWGRVPEQRQPADIQLWSSGLGKGNDLPGGQAAVMVLHSPFQKSMKMGTFWKKDTHAGPYAPLGKARFPGVHTC